MGMDVYGCNPKNQAGEYFRANVWSWRPIHELMFKLGSDLIDERTFQLMGSNDGAGPKSAKVCNEMANRIEAWLKDNPGPLELDMGDEPFCKVTENGQFVTEQMLQENPNLVTRSAYCTDEDHLREWIEFLRNCGGFKVH